MEKFLTVINTCLPYVSVILSALISYFVAGLKAKYEIKKTELTFEHNNLTNLNNAFSELMEKTQYYCEANNQISRNAAAKANAYYMCLTHEKIKPLLKELDSALLNKNIYKVKELRQNILILHSQYTQQNTH